MVRHIYKHQKACAPFARQHSTSATWRDLIASLLMFCSSLCWSASEARAVSIDVTREPKLVTSKRAALLNRSHCRVPTPPPVYCAHPRRQRSACCWKGGLPSSAELAPPNGSFSTLTLASSAPLSLSGGMAGGGGAGGAVSAQTPGSSYSLGSSVQPVPGPIAGQGL